MPINSLADMEAAARARFIERSNRQMLDRAARAEASGQWQFGHWVVMDSRNL